MYRTEKYLRRTCFFDGACVRRAGGEIYYTIDVRERKQRGTGVKKCCGGMSSADIEK